MLPRIEGNGKSSLKPYVPSEMEMSRYVSNYGLVHTDPCTSEAVYYSMRFGCLATHNPETCFFETGVEGEVFGRLRCQRLRVDRITAVFYYLSSLFDVRATYFTCILSTLYSSITLRSNSTSLSIHTKDSPLPRFATVG